MYVKGVNTMNKGSKAMSKVLKVMFVAFMQHCIWSNDTQSLMLEVSKVYSTLYIGALEEWQPVKLCWHWQVQSLT